jgi:hypothetical protein
VLHLYVIYTPVFYRPNWLTILNVINGFPVLVTFTNCDGPWLKTKACGKALSKSHCKLAYGKGQTYTATSGNRLSLNDIILKLIQTWFLQFCWRVPYTFLSIIGEETGCIADTSA